MRVNKSYFSLEEVVSRAIFEDRGFSSLELFDHRFFPMINSVREILGCSVTINNWVWGGDFQYSGFREDAYYMKNGVLTPSFSQHRFGRAADQKPSKMSAKEATKELIKNHKYCPNVSFIEIDRSWLHTDCRNNLNGAPLVLWSPDRGYVTIEEYLNE